MNKSLRFPRCGLATLATYAYFWSKCNFQTPLDSSGQPRPLTFSFGKRYTFLTLRKRCESLFVARKIPYARICFPRGVYIRLSSDTTFEPRELRKFLHHQVFLRPVLVYPGPHQNFLPYGITQDEWRAQQFLMPFLGFAANIQMCCATDK